jgi:thymidylate synthase
MKETETQPTVVDKTNTTWYTQSMNYSFKDQVQQINKSGYQSAPRGLAVREIELAHMKLDPRFTIAHFENRPFNWKYFMGELSWYMIKDRDIDWINNFSSFWKNISENGMVNSNYGSLLFGEQLQWVKDALLKDPQTRQAISFVNQPRFQYEGNKDFVCTMYLNFWIRDNKLNMKVQMRSNDMFYGLTYDAPFFAFVMQTLWYWLREKNPQLELGTYHHCADNMHFYERHFELADKIANPYSEIGNPIFFLLRKPLFLINDGHYILTQKGTNFLQDVSNLVNSGEPFGQEESQEIINKYFYIQ